MLNYFASPGSAVSLFRRPRLAMPSPEETTRFAEAIQSLLSSSPPSLSGSSQTLSVLVSR